MAVCLVTTLREAVSDADLPKINELLIQTKQVGTMVPANHHIVVRSRTPQTVTITDVEAGSGYFTNAAFTENYGTETTLPANLDADLYLTNGTYKIHFPDKQQIRILNFGQPLSAYGFFTLDARQLEGMPSLEQLIAQALASGQVSALQLNEALTYVNFQDASIAGDIKHLAKSRTLLSLNVNRSGIGGSLPNVGTVWPALGVLYASSTGISGKLSAFSGASSLRILAVDGCQNVSGDLEDLSGKTRLEYLALTNSSVSGDLSSLSGCTNLMSLIWSQTSADPSKVTGALSDLSMVPPPPNPDPDATESKSTLALPAFSAITGNVSALKNMAWMNSLTLSNIQGISGDIMDACSGMTALTRLLIENCGGLTGSLYDIRNCTSLTFLTAPNTGLSGPLSSLSAMTQLNTLNLQGCTGVTGTLSDLSTCTALQQLNLGFTQVTGDVEDLASCTLLRTFTAFRLNGISGDLSQMPNGFALFQNAYGISSFSWTSRSSSKMRFSVQGANFGSDLSAMLTDMAVCKFNPADQVRSISVYGTRSGSDSAAVQTLCAEGYSVVINNVQVYS